MRYFSYVQPIFANDGSGEVIGDEIITKSEEEIRREYYPYWRWEMIKKYGQEAFDRDWSFEECIEEWIVTNWAHEVSDAHD